MGGVANLIFVIGAFFIGPISKFLFDLAVFQNLFFIYFKPHPDSMAAKNKILAAFSKLNTNNYRKFDFSLFEKLKLFISITFLKKCISKANCKKVYNNMVIY